MNKYGIKIKNIEAGTLFEYNKGLREHYEYENAMFTNSLFSDFLQKNGLKIQKDGSTTDLICLEFNYGSRSFEEEITHLRKIAKQARLEYKIAKSLRQLPQMLKKYNKRKKIARLVCDARQNKDKYEKCSKEEIRKIFYRDGVDVTYTAYKKNGEIKKKDTVHYKMLYRSTGKAKKGACMFIKEKLYKKARDFLYMGIELPKDNAAIVEISAYAPLISSTAVDMLHINPENILILKDVERTFKTNVISVETDENHHCFARNIKDYMVKNTLFDGQALIDSRIFPEWADGYVLLRQHFCKMASFCCDIQQFFRDYFGGDYENATVKDMFGNLHYVKDIELITTDNAMKWIKFGISYDYWCEKVRENGSRFGIVKTSHASKLGNVQKMSYQMVNSLSEDIMGSVAERSVNYVNRLKTDDKAFLSYLKQNSNFSNDYEALAALCEQNPEFTRSVYFRRRKEYIIKTYIMNLKNGKLIQNADNLVIVGSPYAMLLYGATGNEQSVDNDDTFSTEKDAIQCFTERFDDGEYLAFFRSPFNSRNNLTYLHNVYSENIRKYFHLGKQIIAVNLIGTDFQDRNNGSDQDSDSGYTTNQTDIVEHARKCYTDYPTIVNNIPKDRNIYQNTPEDYARVDSGLAQSQRDIGESSNLAQLAQTYACNFTDRKYVDYVCILSVLAQVAIDNAKRTFNINLTEEIQRIKNDMDIKTHKYPAFWLIIKENFNKANINNALGCPMNYLYHLKFKEYHSPKSTLPMSRFFYKYELKENRKTSKRVEDLISKYSLSLYNSIGSDEENKDKYLLLRNDFDDLINDIRRTYISDSYLGLFSWLLDRAFLITPQICKNSAKLGSAISRNKSLLMKTLYDVNSGCLLKCFSKKQ